MDFLQSRQGKEIAHERIVLVVMLIAAVVTGIAGYSVAASR